MNIYIGNLPKNVSEDALKQTFEQFGHVESIKIMKDRFTGEQRGFAFLQMPTSEEAQQAISQLDGSDFFGNRIRVNEAREPENRNSKRFTRTDRSSSFRSSSGFKSKRY
jgi:RNA recognition motif-containing protein